MHSEWTAEDERQLLELQARKDEVQALLRARVERVAEDMLFYNMQAFELARAMIEHADTVVEALKPFCSEAK